MSLLRKIIFICFTFIFITPLTTHAHVKWFTDIQAPKEPIEGILSPLFLLVTACSVLLIGGVIYLIFNGIMKLSLAQRIDRLLSKGQKWSMILLKYGTAFALILQVLSNSLFAPEFPITTVAEIIWIWLTIIILIIPHHIATKVASISLSGLFMKVLMNIGLFHMLDYGFYLAIIFALFVDKTRFRNLAFPILYIGTGLSLCWVAVEKWVYPMMSIDIVQNHGVPTFGFPVAVFVVLCAFIEFVIGYLLTMGVLNRILAVIVTIVFMLTTMIFGYTEIVGHFMIHIILIIFIIEGNAPYDPLSTLRKVSLKKSIFISLNYILMLAAFLFVYYGFAA